MSGFKAFGSLCDVNQCTDPAVVHYFVASLVAHDALFVFSLRLWFRINFGTRIWL